jgi:hypothetical protein
MKMIHETHEKHEEKTKNLCNLRNLWFQFFIRLRVRARHQTDREAGGVADPFLFINIFFCFF